MKIYTFNQGISRLWIPPNILLIMKLIIIIMISSLMQVSAAGYAQKVSIKEKNISMLALIEKIRTQTGYDFVYGSRLIDKNVKLNVNIQNMELEQALNSLFKSQELTFQIIDRVIAIKRNNSPSRIQLGGQHATMDIRGTVLDEKGNGLPGVSVRVKGTKSTVVTDSNGQFILSGVSNGDILICSYIGYIDKIVMVGESNDRMIISLEVATAQLEGVNVVSTGYQSLPKERATGSFKVIDMEQLDKPATSLAQRLIGTTAGLVSTVDANGNTTFRIRGMSTLTNITTNGVEVNQSNPLIVVDGFPLENTSINDINPNNIESVNILKDAAAASIWGSRASNGVIVITTKTGKKGVPFTAEINTFTRIGSKIDLNYARNLASSAETIQFEKYAFNRWGSIYNSGTLDQLIRPNTLGTAYLNEVRLGRINQTQADAQLARLASLDNSQQIRDNILDNPISNQVNLNITGSTTRMTNALSALFETNSTAFKGTGDKRTMLNYRGATSIYKWLDFDINLMGQYKLAKNNGFTLSDVKSWSPYDMLLNEDGSRVQNFNYGYYQPSLALFAAQFGNKFPYDFNYNPLRELESRNFTNESINFRLQAGLTGKIIPGLTVSSRIQYENNNTFTRNLSDVDSFTARSAYNNSVTWNRTLAGIVTPNLPQGSLLDQSRDKFRGFNFRNQVDFNRTFATDHVLSMVAGAEIRSSVTETFNYPTTYGYNDETLSVGNFPNGPGGAFRPLPSWLGGNNTFGYTNSFSYATRRYYSVFANLAYTYKEKYTLSGSYRTDAANFISATNAARYSPFWSVGGLWQMGREDFIKKVSWVDKLALRLTYGVNGNEDRSTSPFPLINTGAANPETGAIGATISSYGNPTLRWEKTYTMNAGIDFSLFKGKLYGTIEAYQKNGRDLLADVAISIVNGIGSQKLNNVEMYNRGIDLELGSALQINTNVRWRGNFNFSYNDSKITKLFRTGWSAGALVSGGSGAYVEGYNANTLWNYRYAGIQGGQTSLYGPNNVPFTIGTFVGGDARSWMQNSGVTIAPYTLGITNTFDIYRFSVSAIVTGKFGNVFRRSGFNYPWINNDKKSVNSRFSEVFNGDPNQILTLPGQNVTSSTYSVWNNQYPFLDYLTANANLIRLQEVSVSYNTDLKWIKKIGFSNLRIYAQGNNLFTITNNPYNEDPEYALGSVKPTPRYTLGFKLQF